MAILTCKQTCECISLQIFSKYPIQKSRDRTNPPTSQLWKLTLHPGVGGRFKIFSLKWRERMNLKVPRAILPLGCAILSTRAKTVRGGWYNTPTHHTPPPPLRELGLICIQDILPASYGQSKRPLMVEKVKKTGVLHRKVGHMANEIWVSKTNDGGYEGLSAVLFRYSNR